MLEQKFDRAPWTTRQTFLGIFFTLIPWIILAIALTTLNSGSSSARSAALSPQQDLLSAIITFIFSALIEGAFLIAPFYFANRLAPRVDPTERRHFIWESLGFRRFDVGSALALIFVLFLAFLAVNGVYQYLLTALHLHLQTNDQLILQNAKKAPLTTYATLIASVVVAPFCEETFFRGFVFMGFLRDMRLGPAIVLSALIFAVAHADVGSFAVLFIIGLALAFIRWRTHSIWPGMLLHLLNNGIGALLIVLTMQGILH